MGDCVNRQDEGFGIITGYEGDVFKPNNAVTQAEALAMIVRALDMEEEAQEIARGSPVRTMPSGLKWTTAGTGWTGTSSATQTTEDYLEDLAVPSVLGARR